MARTKRRPGTSEVRVENVETWATKKRRRLGVNWRTVLYSGIEREVEQASKSGRSVGSEAENDVV